MEKRLILLVDDNEDLRDVSATLLRFSGYLVLEAEDGAEGVRLARQYRPDLILMDLHMPVLGGWEAMEQLRRSPETAGIPTVALTADPQAGAGGRAREAGFRDVLPKPCRPGWLLMTIREYLEPPRLAAA